jgi:repressor LexA
LNEADGLVAGVTDGALGATGQRIYAFIRDTQAATGLVPSVREIRAAVGVSSIGTVGYWLDKLEALDLIRRDAGKNRSIQLRSDAPSVPVPLVGRIPAGPPRLADQQAGPRYLLPMDATGDGQLFMLRVVGDSMIDAGINHGDYVVVRRQQHADPGAIVAAVLDDGDAEATVKRLAVGADGRARLLAANPRFAPIEADNARILGRVVTVLHRL